MLPEDNVSDMDLNLTSDIHRMNMFVQRSGRVLASDLEKLFVELRNNPQISSLQALFVLRCCGAALGM